MMSGEMGKRKMVVWILGIVFASIFIIQYLDVAYSRDGMVSVLSTSGGSDEAQNVSGAAASASGTVRRSISIAPQNALSPFSPTPTLFNVAHHISNSTSTGTGTAPPPNSEYSVPLVASPEYSKKEVLSISDMNHLLLQSRSSYSKKPLWASPADEELLDARFKIQNAAATTVSNAGGLYPPVYRNVSTFIRSYELMEEKLKVYVYGEGKGPVFHEARMKGIYASEGWFMKKMKESKHFITEKAEEAHLFYMPFSSQMLAQYVYLPNSHSFDRILHFLTNYLHTIKTAHSSWNRTDGADHFLVACHDWAAFETRHVMPNSIRALCNSDVKEGFQFGKDVSLPETYVHSSQEIMGGNPPSGRKILAFFAGQMHGYVRPILLKYWENKDPDMRIYGKMRKGYSWHMKNSKYCICAKGYEVNSPRVVEAIMYGCVPVIISDNFVPPFFDVLKWESFAVFVEEKNIPDLKKILVSISERRYSIMQHRVKQVRQHFVWHQTPIKYDIFHMILHSIWYNRIFLMSPN